MSRELTLRDLRNNKNLTLREVSEHSGVHLQSIARFERGKQRPRKPIRILMSQIYEVTLDTIDQAVEATCK